MAELRASLVCDRIRAQISIGLDEELSQLERAMVASHLDRCPACAEYAVGVTAVASALRDAPPEQLSRRIVVHRPRRQLRSRVPAVAQVAAVAAAVVASIFVGTELSGTQSVPAEHSFVPEGTGQLVPPSMKQLQIEQALLERAEVGRPVDLGGRVL